MTDERKTPAGESGFILMQVVVTSAVLLYVLLTGFTSVRRAIQTTATVATSVDFKDFTQRIQLELAKSETCLTRLNLNASDPIASLQVSGGRAISIRDTTGRFFAYEEDAPAPVPHYPIQNGFKMQRVRVSAPTVAGWVNSAAMPANGRMQTAHYVGEIVIQGQRRMASALNPNQVFASFLGSQDMFARIPILFSVDSANNLHGCTTRPMYQTPLGPPPAQRYGIDCIDRGGAVVADPDGGGFSVCRLPVSSFAVCDPGDPSLTTLPGWTCYKKTDPSTLVTYAY